MTNNEDDPDDDEVAQMAVAALSAAQRRARASGRPMVVVENDELVRIDAAGKTVLKKLPPCSKVSVRIKRASK